MRRIRGLRAERRQEAVHRGQVGGDRDAGEARREPRERGSRSTQVRLQRGPSAIEVDGDEAGEADERVDRRVEQRDQAGREVGVGLRILERAHDIGCVRVGEFRCAADRDLECVDVGAHARDRVDPVAHIRDGPKASRGIGGDRGRQGGATRGEQAPEPRLLCRDHATLHDGPEGGGPPRPRQDIVGRAVAGQGLQRQHPADVERRCARGARTADDVTRRDREVRIGLGARCLDRALALRRGRLDRCPFRGDHALSAPVVATVLRASLILRRPTRSMTDRAELNGPLLSSPAERWPSG